MPLYTVTEVVEYLVTASSEQEACDLVTDAADRNKWCIGVADRYAVAEEEE